MKLIGRAVMIVRINQAIDEHRQGLAKANSYSYRNRGARMAWVGHTQRIEALKSTLRRICAGDPCNRAVAQMFGAGYRIDNAPDTPETRVTYGDKEVPF